MMACGLVFFFLSCSAWAQQESSDDLLFLQELSRDIRRGGSYASQRDLEEYLAEYPQSRMGRDLAARGALARGRVSEALDHLGFLDDASPRLLAKGLLRAGRLEEALTLGGELKDQPLLGGLIQCRALDGLGRRLEAQRRAQVLVADVDDRDLDGFGLMDYGAVLLFLRRFEVANQALVFADAELNGRQGRNYVVNEPEVLVLLGEVFHAARQSGSDGDDRTLKILNSVLDVDPSHADALVVKAKVYMYGMNGRAADEALAQALIRDPSHPGALVMQARARLQARRSEECLALADRVLRVNPRHRGALAVRAVALVVTGAEGADEAQSEFKRRHPESAEYDALLGEVLQWHYRFAESVPAFEEALQKEAGNDDALPLLAQSLAHLGRESEARAALEEHRHSSPFSYPWRENMLKVLLSLEEKEERMTESGMRLLLPPGESEITGSLLEEALEAARTDMASRWDIDPPREVLIEVFDRHEDFSVRTVGFTGFGALGACFGNVVTLVSPLSEIRGSFHWRQTAVHEYAHVVTLALSNHRIPRWLTEGVSVVEEKKADPSWEREFEREVLSARANGQIPSVLRMDELFRDGQTVQLGYFLGSVVCEVVEEKFGFSGLRELVAAYGEGRTTQTAIRHALGVDPEVLDEYVARYIEGNVASRAAIRPRYNAKGKNNLQTLVSAGESEALLPLSQAYLDLGQLVDAEASLQRYLKTHPVTADARRVRAELLMARGDQTGALAELEIWSEEGGRDADGWVSLATLRLDGDDKLGAVSALKKAQNLNPRDTSPTGPTRLLLNVVGEMLTEEERIHLLQEVCAHDEVALQERVLLARHFREGGEAGVALKYYSEIVDIDPYLPRNRMDYADLLHEGGEAALAAEQWRAVLAIRVEHLPATYFDRDETVDRRGGVEIRGGNLAEQLQALQEEARRRLDVQGDEEH